MGSCRPSDTGVLHGTALPYFVEGYVQFRGSSDFDFEVVAVDVDGRHELIEQCAAFGVGGGEAPR